MKESRIDRFEGRTGYRPLTVIVHADQVYLFYETLALSRRELQKELVDMLVSAHEIWPDPKGIVISVLRRPRLAGADSRVGSLMFHNEVVTARAASDDVEEYGNDDAQALWDLCIFTRWIFRHTTQRDLRLIRYPYLLGSRGVQS